MTDPMMIKYGIGMALFGGFMLMSILFYFVAKKHTLGKKGIIFHFLLGGTLYAGVIVFTNYLEMALKEFHIKFISVETINYIQTLLFALIAIKILFFFANGLEEVQIKKGADKTSARFITRVLKITIFISVVLLFGEHFGLSLSGLMTFGGIGGIALGFASRDVLGNFFSGVMLYFDRPFEIGDWIKSSDREIEGIVVEVGWRMTKIMTFQNRPLYIPNSLFSSITIENPGRMTNRCIDVVLGLRCEDASKMSTIIDELRSMLRSSDKIDQTQDLLVNFNAFADSSLNIMVHCFTKTVKWEEWLEAQQEIFFSMIEIIQKHGADLAYPTETLNVNNDQNPFLIAQTADNTAQVQVSTDSIVSKESTVNTAKNSSDSVGNNTQNPE
ncbi:mechanosensitive ion channel family protein [Ignatzschineria sp. LJL83]